MAATLCGCTAPRCMTPTQPIIKRKIKPGSRQIASIASIPEHTGTDSRYTSTKSEDLREIQKLFKPDEDADAAKQDHETGSQNGSSGSKHSKIASFFRRRLSRTFSKSVLDKPVDPEKLKEAKNEIKANLLTENGPEAGGYDADVAILDNVEETLTSRTNAAEEMDRGRQKTRRHSVHHSTWSGPK